MFSASAHRPFVVAFAGARDGYQVPLAFAERGALARLVTDVYLPHVPAALSARAPRLGVRHVAGVSALRTWSSPQAIWHTYGSWRLAARGSRSREQIRALKLAQDALSTDALRFALLHDADLLLYGGYARIAFADKRMENRRRILFMYHPHVGPSAELLRADLAAHAGAESSLDELREDEADRDIDDELHRSTAVVCASAFTARTVKDIGIPASKVHVVPYGIDVSTSSAPDQRASDRCRFLFVGSGIHRKGLHVLFEAWRRAGLKEAELTVVCRTLTPWIAERMPADVVVRRGVSAPELDELYAQSDVFVMPSLVEGFGYVYLEALARGCFCIGTANTGLPDLNPPAEVAALTAAGDVDSLVSELKATFERWKSGALKPAQIRRFAATWDWARFRTSIAALSSR